MEHHHAHVIPSAGGVSGHGQHVDGVEAIQGGRRRAARPDPERNDTGSGGALP